MAQGNNLVVLDLSGIIGGSLSFNAWLHIAIAGNAQINQTYLRIDLPDQPFGQTMYTPYMPLFLNGSSYFTYIAIGQNMSNGFIGDFREFLFAQQFINSTQVSNIKNQVIYWNNTQYANYRLQGGDLRDFSRPFNQTGSLINSTQQVPTWTYDNSAPIDMCQTFVNYTSLFKVNSDVMNFSSAQLDSRLQATSNFQYTSSFWMKTYPGFKTTTNPQVARDGLNFFNLNQAFVLWFSDQTSIRIFFHATNNVYEKQGQPIQFPLGQWANLQIQIDRTTGYDMRVYDLQRREISRVADSTLFLQAQNPTGSFNILRNFKGYIKQIMLYTQKLTLPVDQTNGQFEMINNAYLMIYYKFDQQYFNSTISQYGSLATNQINGGTLYYGPSISLVGNLTFDVVEWDQSITFSSPSSIGTLLQSINLYDGMACQKNLSTFYRLNGTNSSFTYILPNLISDITQATVEFWFKLQVPMPQDNYLFSIYSPNSQQEYFKISQSNGTLLCQPFTGLVVTIQSYNPNITSWQHVFCRYESTQDVTSSIMQNSISTLSQRIYTKLSTGAQSLPGNNSYILIIGNRYQGGFGQTSTYFKEFRFWTTARTLQQIEATRYTQVISDSSLLLYLKLASNLLTPLQNQSITRIGVMTDLELQPPELLICPQNSIKGHACFRNPFIKHILLMVRINTTAVEITSKYSNMVSVYNYRNLIYLTNNQSGNNSLVISGNISFQLVNQFVTNIGKTFYSSASLIALPNACQYISPTNNSQPMRIFEQYLPQTPGINDITLSYHVYNSCISTMQFNDSMTEWTLYPMALKVMALGYNRLLQVYQLTIPSSELAQLNFYQDQYIVGKFYWTDGSFQNQVYKIRFIENFQPNLTAPNNNVLLAEDLVIDGSLSRVLNSSSQNYSDSESRSGLSYFWTCPSQFQDVCIKFNNRRSLTVTYSDFVNYTQAQFNTVFQFQLQVFKGMQPEVNLDLIPSISLNITWLNILRPQFKLSPSSIHVLASSDNTFNLKLKNYDFNDPNLQIAWNLTGIPLELVQNVTQISIPKGTLAFNTSYTLTATVTHLTYQFATSTQSYTWVTGLAPPVNGSIVVSPTVGVAMVDSINFSIYNWNVPRNFTTINFRVVLMNQTTGNSLSLISYSNNQMSTTLPQFNGPVTIEIGANDTYEVTQVVSVPISIVTVELSSSSNINYTDPTSISTYIYQMNTNTNSSNLKLSILQNIIGRANNYGQYQIIDWLLQISSGTINSDIATLTIQTLNTVIPGNNVSLAQNTASTISNLLVFYNSTSTPSTGSSLRLLQQRQQLSSVISLISQLGLQLCTYSDSALQTSLQTNSFQLIVEPQPLSLRTNLTYFDGRNSSNKVAVTQSRFPIQCVMVTYYYAASNTSMSVQILGVNLSQQYNLSIQLAYDFNYTSNNFKNNQTVIEQDTKGNWSYTTTTYDVVAKLMNSQCSITSNNSVFFSIITDTNRVLIVDAFNLLQMLLQAILNFDNSVVVLLLFLILFNIVMPILATCLDRKMYQHVQLQIEQGENEFLMSIAKKTERPYNQIIYGESLFLEYQQDMQGLWPRFKLLYRNLHPIAGLYHRFDIEYKRLTRFIVVSLQISLIAIICGISFSSAAYRIRDQYSLASSTDMLDQMDVTLALIVGAILSVLTLPLPECLICCLRSHMIVKEENEGKSYQDQEKKQQHIRKSDADGAEEVSEFHFEKTRNDDNISHLPNTTNIQFNNQNNESVENIDKCLCLKLLLLVFCFLFAFAAILIVAFMSSQSTKTNSQTMNLAFFSAILFGYIIVNNFRVFINAVSVQGIIDSINSEEEITCSIFVSNDTQRMLEDMIVVQQIKDSSDLKEEEQTPAPSPAVNAQRNHIYEIEDEVLPQKSIKSVLDEEFEEDSNEPPKQQQQLTNRSRPKQTDNYDTNDQLESDEVKRQGRRRLRNQRFKEDNQHK